MTRRLLPFLPAVALVLAGSAVPPAAAAAIGCQYRPASIVGTPGDDDLVGTPGNDVVWLDAGADTFRGRGGDDLICGGPGADTLLGGKGNDRLFDRGTDEPTLPRSDEEADAADDVLDGGPGDDFLVLSLGSDAADGGKGQDSLQVGSTAEGLGPTAEGLVVDARTGTMTGEGADAIAGFEVFILLQATFFGTDAAEYIRGADEVHAGGGDDDVYPYPEAVVDLGPGDDTAYFWKGTVAGGPGADYILIWGTSTVAGGRGPDLVRVGKNRNHDLSGGAGADEVMLRADSPMVVDLARGTVDYTKSDHRASIQGFQHVSSGAYDDVLRGSARNEIMLGGGGRDLVNGRGGTDRCVAETVRRCEK